MRSIKCKMLLTNKKAKMKKNRTIKQSHAIHEQSKSLKKEKRFIKTMSQCLHLKIAMRFIQF